MFRKKQLLEIRQTQSAMVFSGPNAPLILSGGAFVEMQMKSDGQNASIVLSSPDGSEVKVVSGSPVEISEAYSKACRDLVHGCRSRAWMTVAAIAICAAAAGATYYAFKDRTVAESRDSGPLLGEVLQSLAGSGDIPQQLPLALQRPAAEHEADLLPPQQQIPGDIAPAIPEALKIPDVLPEIVVPDQPPANAPEGPSAVITAEPESQDPAFDLPAYSPDLWTPPPASTESRSEDPNTDAARPEGKEDAVPASAPDNEAALPAAESSGNNVPGEAEDTAAVDSAATETPQASASPSEGHEEGSASGNASEAEPVSEIDLEKAKEDATAAVGDLIEKGMTAQDAMDILNQLEEIGKSGGEITPEMLASLPHEIANLLVEQGLVSEDAPDGIPYRIIRMPPSVLDQYRGEDGIPSIPEANSWAATGNYVRIPLPGGGDINEPDDLKEFGLDP